MDTLENNSRKEIHFYLDEVTVPFPVSSDVEFHTTYDSTNKAIMRGVAKIHTTSLANISLDLLDLGYRIFAHRNNKTLECKLGSMDGTEKEIRKPHNILRLIMGHHFDKYFET